MASLSDSEQEHHPAVGTQPRDSTLIPAPVALGHQGNHLEPAFFNKFPHHVSRAVSGRSLTFVEQINSEAGESREDNEVRQVLSK